MRSVNIFFDQRTFSICYDIETFSIGAKKDSPIVNVFSVFVKEPTLIDVAGAHFTLVHDITYPGAEIIFNIRNPHNDREKLFKQIVAKAIFKDFYNYSYLASG
jgi:hypothetical protein